ncbi:MAG: DUF885 domain-containing protein [Acidobacteria bacterium]|nr:DUF885 domain-containing protein [Acidobacteriota bacterium]
MARGYPFAAVAGLMMACASCGGVTATSAGPGGADSRFISLAREVVDDYLHRHPTLATDLGIHREDDRLEEYSAAAIQREAAALRGFRSRLEAIDRGALTAPYRLDHEQLAHALDAALLQIEVIRPWARDPDLYSSGLTRAAHVLIKRSFARPSLRAGRLIARMNAMPGALAEARRNLDHPPRVYTEIAIEQIEGNKEFFRTAVLDAFPSVKGAARAQLAESAAGVVRALDEYGRWLRADLLPRSTGDFAYGEATYRARLLAEEQIDLPLDRLLEIAEQDLARNQEAFARTARLIDPDPSRSPADVLAMVVRDRPPASRLLAATQAELDALASFLEAGGIVTLPAAAPVRVIETPPFMRATVTASMDIPGPYEKVATEAYYTMTLPDPRWPAADRDAYMEQWYYPAITNVSVHEVWPGHYLQFLHARQLESDVRKVFGAVSNTEGWAHYVEQMMIDEGFHGDDPRYRLAQLHDALLRNVRFIAGIAMHTRGMTVDEAMRRFERDAYQPTPVARAEARRGTSDATYGYYTMGKLVILKLRDDYRAARGSAYSLRAFHDEFVRLGPLALPLVRQAMLGERNALF